MNDLTTDLVLMKLDTARFALSEAKTIQETKVILDVATAAEILAKRQQLGDEAITYATSIKVEALAQLGRMLKEIPKNAGARGIGKSGVPVQNPTLADMGLDKKTSKLAQDIASLPQEKIDAIKNGIMHLSGVSIEVKRNIVRKAETEINQVGSESINIFTTNNKYQIIYADPAWDYWSGGAKNQSLHYRTMSLEQIKSLPIKRISDDNCILFLWVTYPILKDAFNVIESWGFNYSTAGFVWVKKNSGGTNFFGLGSWTRANTELCLIATKGSITRMDASISQVIESEIEEHSKKPAIIRELITKLVGKLPRIELFSRQVVDGWDHWGDEISVNN